MGMVPSPWAAFILAVAIYRTWHLIALDTILDGPRDRLLGAHDRLDKFVACPWCCGTWVMLGWWGAWAAYPVFTLSVATLAVLSMAAPVGSRLMDD